MLGKYGKIQTIHNWLVVYLPSEKYAKVSWDDDMTPTEWKVIKFMFQTTNQHNYGLWWM